MSEIQKKISIGDRCIGDGYPAFIVLEIGSNHDGDIEKAKRYIDKAAKIGADAVKFQTIDLNKLLSDKIIVNGRLIPNESKNGAQFISVPHDWYPELFDYAKRRDLVAFSTPFDLEAVDILLDAGAELMKVASCDLTNLDLIKKVGLSDKPILLSTGMGNLAEVHKALETLYSTGNDKVIVLHCVASYPAAFEDVNLRAMLTMRAAFQVPVGLSDHTLGPTTALGAVALGACAIEKHATLDRQSPGTDHFFAMEFPEFEEMIQMIRELETAMGNGKKHPSEAEKGRMAKIRRALYTRRAIAKGEVIQASDLIALRPQRDFIKVKEFDDVLGLRAPRNYEKGEPLRWTDFLEYL
ncbi:MAG: N-acetylneuraminate synthase family protein [Desulfobacteraceae bacterium]|jgi:sialic acid synthase SpsE